ncbi:hypothetical protein SSU98_1512 [Streptococcus suis 98HAH33]|nr:hypothetical protein SSU05_1502 [Streptococcus suis 05ZYH33]ABP92671.1 hypothetical protein SSU98_1512 [Streptococcus suis 98HAH33]
MTLYYSPLSLKLLHSYHTLKEGIFQEKTGYFTERNNVNAFLFKVN